jgi:hypothetical protein
VPRRTIAEGGEAGARRPVACRGRVKDLGQRAVPAALEDRGVLVPGQHGLVDSACHVDGLPVRRAKMASFQAGWPAV